MARLYIMQSGLSTWQQQDRAEPASGAPLTEDAARQVTDTAEELAGEPIGVVYSASGESELQTARLVARKLALKARTENDLRDVDYGLWQGLTFEEIKRRQPKLYKEWTSAHAGARPPQGETFAEAQQRLRRAVRGILKRYKNRPPLLVLRPVALGLLRCLLLKERIEALWRYVDAEFTWASFDAEMDAI